MKTTSPLGFINLTYWFFRIAFWFQLLVAVFIIAVNYLSFNSKGSYFTVRGGIRGYELVEPKKDVVIDSTKSPVSISDYGVATMDTVGMGTTYFFNHFRMGFMRIDYTDFAKAFTLKNIVWLIADISLFILWLIVTFQLVKILQSIKDRSAFISRNIRRITIIGCTILFIPFVELARDQLFFNILKEHLHLPRITFLSNFTWWDFFPFTHFSSNGIDTYPHHSYFPTIAVGLIVLVIAQIFKNGFDLQKEKDLTI